VWAGNVLAEHDVIKQEIGVLRELVEKSEGDRDARERQQQHERVKKGWICWWLVHSAVEGAAGL